MVARAGALDDAIELAGVEPELFVGAAARDRDAAERDRLHRPAAGRAQDRGGARPARGHHIADDIVGDVGSEQADPALDLGGGELGAGAARAAPDVAALAAQQLDAAARTDRNTIAISHSALKW